MGKTETIKQRAIYVYLPSLGMVERWKALAEGAGTSVSRFVVEHVENSLRQDEEGYRSRGSLIEENRRQAGRTHRHRHRRHRLGDAEHKAEA